MRTTIEMRDDLRAGLLALAARRRMRGFSALVEKAVENFLRAEAAREEAVGAALRLAGTLDAEEADHMRSVARRLRRSGRIAPARV